MALYLVQHGKSLPKDIDPEKRLSEEGIAEVEKIAQAAKGYKIPVSLPGRSKRRSSVFRTEGKPFQRWEVDGGCRRRKQGVCGSDKKTWVQGERA